MPTTLGSMFWCSTEMTSLTQTQSFANGELTAIENDVVHTSNAGQTGRLNVGDTMALGGVDYTIVEGSGGFVQIDFDAGAGAQSAYGNVTQLEMTGPGGTVFASLLGGGYGSPLAIPAGAEILGYTPDTVTDGWGANAWSFNTPAITGAPIGPGTAYDYGTNEYAAPAAPCFTPGNMIETPDGLRDVDDLVEGDLVLTKDHGAQPVRWVFKRGVTASWFKKNPDLTPVIIAKDAFGPGMPSTDSTVSPGHMMLLTAKDENGADTEILVPARQLVESGAARRADHEDTTFIHLMFDQHEIVKADGTWSESFRPAPATLHFLSTSARNELLRIFPQLATISGLNSFPPARPSLFRRKARTAIKQVLGSN